MIAYLENLFIKKLYKKKKKKKKKKMKNAI